MSSPNYHYILRGTIKEEEERLYLELPDKTKFKVKKILADYPTEECSYFTTLNMTAEGKIMSVNLEEISEEPTESAMRMTGTVTVVGKKMAFAQIKVSRPPLKTLKISVHPAHQNMRTGQKWSVIAVRQEDVLVMTQCQTMESEPSGKRQ
ncbi:hypothetical protein [Crocosphaera sp. Alani8]|uniref:hypothetical protein n=1 Tax=Crocosphaera sp. Alani8 TaxID=3038952 RepID=UPI00313D4BD4